MKLILFIFSIIGVLGINHPDKTSQIHTIEPLPEMLGHSGNSTKGARVDRFSFSHQGKEQHGLIYLPATYLGDPGLPVIFLIDFAEQHFKLATDEFEKIIEATNTIPYGEAMVVTLDHIPDIDATPINYMEHYDLYYQMALAVENIYQGDRERILIGKGSEAGIVMTAMFKKDDRSSIFHHYVVTDPSPMYASSLIKIISNDDFPRKRSRAKLHFSYSKSNDRMKCQQLIDLLNAKDYPWLLFRSKEYDETGFENTYPKAYLEGLSFVFNSYDE